MSVRRIVSSLLVAPLLLAACAGDEPERDPDAEYGMMGPLSPTPPPGKEDGLLRRGLAVNTDTRRTQVWSAVNRWEDTDTTAARAAGVAWGEDSGLTWDEKYALWIESMPRTTGVMGYPTFIMTTPWGKTLESPALECAELSIFLRITFAAWYGLPFYMEAMDSSGTRIYFGHNGVRTANGRYASTPEYAVVYRDHSGMSRAEYEASWPEDSVLRGRALAGGSDEQPMIGEGATSGTYLDEIHLNKRRWPPPASSASRRSYCSWGRPPLEARNATRTPARASAPETALAPPCCRDHPSIRTRRSAVARDREPGPGTRRRRSPTPTPPGTCHH